MAKGNDMYDCCAPLRLTKLQDSEIRKAAKEAGVTVNQLVRDTLVSAGVISQGPTPKARKGYVTVTE